MVVYRAKNVRTVSMSQYLCCILLFGCFFLLLLLWCILFFSPLTVLVRLGGRKASSLGMALSSVLDQVAKLPLPHTKEQEEDDVFSFCRCCTDMIDFVRPFVQEVRHNLPNNEMQSETTNRTVGRQGKDKEDELRTELLKL